MPARRMGRRVKPGDDAEWNRLPLRAERACGKIWENFTVTRWRY